MRFYLGTHKPHWLWGAGEFFENGYILEDVRLFISANRLRDWKTFGQAKTRYAIDSGGFTQIAQHGRWTISERQYVSELAAWRDEIGPFDWAAPQDWMCEPHMLTKTGLSVASHQSLTINNLATLRSLAPDLPIIPVLQGWQMDDYWRHVDQYLSAGFDLTKEPLVGVGSVCRRQNTGEVQSLMRGLCEAGIKPHGFGFKIQGIAKCAQHLVSTDSMAWSFAARRSTPLPGCTHAKCSNCPRYEKKWYTEKIVTIPGVEP